MVKKSKIKSKIIISCLPVAGIGNPYQYLMMKGLNEDDRIEAISGIHNRFFGIILTALKQRPDYIHLDWIQSYYHRRYLWLTILLLPLFVIQILIVKYLLGVKLVWTLHNIEPHDAKYNWLHKFCQRYFASKCHIIRVFSHSTLTKAVTALKISKERIRVIPEGSYVGYYPNNISKIKAREKLKILSNSPVLLYLGFIKPYKGIDKLLKAFKRFYAMKKDAVLIIAGKVMDQSYYHELRENSTAGIKWFPEFIKEQDMQVYYNAADVVVLPFEQIENSGSVIVAMGFKKPIIAPSMGVLPNRLRKQSELLYEDDIWQAMQKLEKIDSKQLQAFGESNYHQLEQYKWEDFSSAFTG